MTNIIKRSADNVVIYVGDDLTLDHTAARGAGWQDFNTTTANASLVTGTPPATWVGGAYSFDGTTWTIVNQALIRVPQSVSRAQALAALSNAGLLTQAQNAASASTNPLVLIFWNNAQTFERNSSTVATLGGALGLTDVQIDSLFIAASTITA
ncbi:hypothetical protein PQR01_00420 [Paraburkholderia rhynchosiae]|uniref:Uncharacterized protein n=1 Tax=Paraburkholderia rhynchosiae TaxID=487049 RepID=A0ACC7N5M3_9BURK